MGEHGLPRVAWVLAGLALLGLVLFALQGLRSWHAMNTWRVESARLPNSKHALEIEEQMALALAQAQRDRSQAQITQQPSDLQHFRTDTARLGQWLQGRAPTTPTTIPAPGAVPLRVLIAQGLHELQEPLVSSSDLDQRLEGALTIERRELDSELARAQQLGHQALTSSALALALLLASALLALSCALQAERRTARSQSLRRESDRRQELLATEAVDYGWFGLDPGGRVRQWSRGAERLHGYTAAEIEGRPWSQLYTEADRIEGLPQAMLERAAQRGRDEGEGWRSRQDSGRCYVGVIAHALRDARGRLQGFAVIERNLTETRQRLETLERVQAALMQSQRMEALGQLSSGIAHEFRNVVQVIENCVRTLRRRLSVDRPAATPYLEMIERNTGRATVLTRRLLEYARRAPLQREPVEVNRLMSEVADLLRHTVSEAITIELELAATAALIEVDANQFEAALLNLAVNARDAMPMGGRLTLTTAVVTLEERAREASYVVVSVRDTGVGMDELTLQRVREPFFSSKPSSRGIGLGLAQVRGFAEQSGGRMRIESMSGEGTQVQLYLPRVLGASALPADRQQSA